MGWLRFGGSVALMLAACGGATADRGAMRDAAAGEAPIDASVFDVESDADSMTTHDADADARGAVGSCDGLASADAGDSMSCEVNGPSALSCSGELRFRYYCGSTMPPPAVPPIPGCFFSAWAFGMFDCPAASVRDASNDARCPERRAFAFPSTDGTTSAVAVPTNCDAPTHLPNTTPAALFGCCD